MVYIALENPIGDHQIQPDFVVVADEKGSTASRYADQKTDMTDIY